MCNLQGSLVHTGLCSVLASLWCSTFVDDCNTKVDDSAV